MQKFVVMAQDGYELDVHVFEAKNAKAVVQIVHGMEEHQGRYERFADFLVKNGFSVVSSDMRGHGSSAKTLGHFKDKNGYIDLVCDQVEITKFINQKFANLPVYIFAHSMGTIISRVLLQQHSQDYSKVVLSGYPNYRRAATLGIFITNVLKFFCGPKFKSKLVENLAIGAFNKKVKNPRTKVDWISANEDNIDAYIADPLCGIGFTMAAFNDLFHLVIKMHKPKNYVNVNSNLPILLLRGSDDPCTGGEKGASNSRKILATAGFKDISHIDYSGLRHEILNEKEYQKVQNDILGFYNL